jgi:formamidopyrimidine-DNA glycosylase
MPELPEVETMARDLAPLVEGAVITGVWWDWDKVIRDPSPAEFERRVVGCRVQAVGRRAKWLVLDLSDDTVMAIQVKMTGLLRTICYSGVRRFSLEAGRRVHPEERRP